MATRILITDSEQGVALAATRSLGRAGYEVITCGHRRFTFAALSRHSRQHHRVPDPLLRGPAFATAVRELCVSHRVDVLLPMTDAALFALLPIRDSIPSKLPWPALGTVERAADKLAVRELAARVGIAVPPQVVLASPRDAGRFDPAGLRFPVVIKPGRSISGERQHAVVHAADAQQLRQRLDDISPTGFPLMLQERVVGPGIGIFLLRWQGRLCAQFAHRRIREHPPSGGASVYCESIVPEPALVAASVRLLEQLDWNGVAMVELKVESRTGIAYLMETNGRFWGSLQLAIDAGVDFPRLLVELAMGGSPQAPPPVRTGVRLRALLRDLDHLLARVRWSAGDLDLPSDAPTRRRALAAFFQWRPGDRLEFSRLSDPWPALAELVNFFRRRS